MKQVPTIILVAGLLATALPSRVAAQDETCRSLRFRSNFRLNGAQQHISQADGSSYADTKRRMAQDALHTLTDAVQAGQDGGADPFTTWYFFGRAYLLLDDLVGADSSFTRAEALVPGDPTCLAEIRRLRRNQWVRLQQAAVAQLQSQNYDSALVFLRRATLIFREDPSGYMNMAAAFLSQNKEDSAAVAFRLAAHAGRDTARADLRAQAMMNAARLEQRNNHLLAAESLYREYTMMKPRDMAARGALATVLKEQHRDADAAAVYDAILASADSLDAFQLFDTGVSLFNLAAADTVRADSVQKNAMFTRAATAFAASVRKNPWSRDAAYNLANAYLASDDAPHLMEAARRLVGLDSLNRVSWSLLASAYRDIGRGYAVRDSVLRARRDSLPAAAQYNAAARAYRDSTLAMLMHRDSLPIELTISRFDPRDSTAAMRGVVRNLKDREHAAFTLVIEFVNAGGDVVTTERVEVPILNAMGSPGQAYDFSFVANGRGIAAYRYRVS